MAGPERKRRQQFGDALALLAASLAGAAAARADPPELEAWLRNVDGTTGYAGILVNVQAVDYTDDSVWVSATGIPAYSIGPWPMNPNDASDQSHRFRFPRNPVEQTGAHTPTPLGAIGAFTSGVSIFNAKDAFSFQNRGVWNQNAVVAEAPSFDACLGHAPPNGEYHHHQNPICLYTASAAEHSPIVGYAFDGYPIYGAYGYANSDGSGGIRRIESSYQPRNISVRQVLPDGTVLPPQDRGPPVGANAPLAPPLGYYLEDFEYVPGLGDLDEHNGRFAVTPDSPGGAYAYYATTAANGTSAYPYLVGPTYRGVADTANFGQGPVPLDPAAIPYTGPSVSVPALPSPAAPWTLALSLLLVGGLWRLGRGERTQRPRSSR